MVYSYSGILQKNEKEPTTAKHNTDESHGCDVARKNLDTKEVMWCDSIYMKFKIMKTTTVVSLGKY